LTAPVNQSSNQPAVASIDIGTTSTKGLVVQADGKIIGSHQEYYTTSFPQRGFAEQDPDLVFQSVVKVLKALASKRKVSGICFSAAMHSIMVVDKHGQPLTGLIVWSDTRSTSQADYLIHEKLSQQLYETTGTPVHPMSPLCKLMWLKENNQDAFTSAYKFISIKEYVFFKLTGEFIIDHSTASATGLFDLDKKQWSSLALSLAGISAEKLSRAVPVNTAITINKEIASESGWENVPLIIGASDGCLAQLGSHAMSEKDLSITIGTSGAVRVASKSRMIDPNGKIFNYILDDSTFICGGATNNGAALLSWYTMQIDSNASTDIIGFVDEVMQVPPGCQGLVMIPHVLGERAPVYNPNARGVFFGVSIEHNKQHFQRALIEGICFQIRWIAECTEELVGKRERKIVSGGFTRSENWIQILSDVLGEKLTLQETQDASGMGAIILGFKTLQVQTNFSSRSSKDFIPNRNAHKVYSDSFKKYKALYSAVEKLF